MTKAGILADISSPHDVAFGVTLPMIENDGRSLRVRIQDRTVTTSYLDGGDKQTFSVLNDDAKFELGELIRSTYGDLRPVQVTAEDSVIQVLINPRIGESNQR
jgi:hypothetical protein